MYSNELYVSTGSRQGSRRLGSAELGEQHAEGLVARRSLDTTALHFAHVVDE